LIEFIPLYSKILQTKLKGQSNTTAFYSTADRPFNNVSNVEHTATDVKPETYFEDIRADPRTGMDG
jgi:hypothetical protein